MPGLIDVHWHTCYAKLKVSELQTADMSEVAILGAPCIAGGVTEVMKLARHSLRMGATPLKIAGGGGVTALYDPVDVQGSTFEEMKAAVDVAETFDTYVAAQIFTDAAIRTAIRAGVKSIDHGNLIESRETLQDERPTRA